MLSEIYDALKQMPNIQTHLYYDELWHRIMIDRSLFSLQGVRPLDDHIISEFRYLIETQTKKEASHDDMRRAMVMYALHNRMNPFIERIRHVTWDNTQRVNTFLRDMNCRTNLPGEDNAKYLTWVSRAIFLSVIQRQLTNGIRVDFTPVIIGGQGTGKSTLCEKISLGWYNTNQNKANDERRFYEKADGSIICELQEGTQFDEYEEEFKSLIDQKYYQFEVDGYIEKITIRNIMIATTNKELFLRDLTGNRRFYPVEIVRDTTKENPVFALTTETMEQIWAEALHRYTNGERWNDGKTDIDRLSAIVQKERVIGYYGRDEVMEILSKECPNYGDTITYTKIRFNLMRDYGFNEDNTDKVIHILSRNLEDLGFSRCKSLIKSHTEDGKSISSRGIYREYPLF